MLDSRPWFSLRRDGAPHLATHLAIAGAYALAALLALEVGPARIIAASVWPPVGLALAVLLLFGPRWWPGILLGAVLANLTRGTPVPASIAIAVGNTLTTMSAAWALRRFGFCTSIYRVRDALLLIGMGALTAPVLAATSGTLSVHLLAGAPRNALPTIWLNWWSGDAIAVMLVTPLLLSWLQGSRPILSATRIVEIILLAGGLIAG